MKVKPFEATPKTEKVVLLKLKDRGGYTDLIVVNGSGDAAYSGNLLKITPDGKVEFYAGISGALGLQLTSAGRLQINGSIS